MRTVLIDNSLCSLSLRDDADPELIYRYICALADAGVRYVELDFRTLMKLDSFPSSMKYIFRLIDPVFLQITEHFKFDYLAVSFGDVRKGVKSSVPIMLSLPIPEDFSVRSPADVVRYSKNLVQGDIALVNMYGAYPLMTRREVWDYLGFLRGSLFVPVNICPLNNKMAAASNAVNFAACGADCVTVTMGSSVRCCSLEEYFTLLMLMMRSLPKELNYSAAAEAARLHGQIFKNGSLAEIERLLKLHENDMLNLINAETGEKIRLGKTSRDQRLEADAYDDSELDVREFNFSLYNYNKLGRGGRFRSFLN